MLTDIRSHISCFHECMSQWGNSLTAQPVFLLSPVICLQFRWWMLIKNISNIEIIPVIQNPRLQIALNGKFHVFLWGTANLEGLIQTRDELRGWANVQSKINGIILNWELCKSTLVQSNGKTTELEIHCNVLWTVQLLNVQRFLFFSDCQIFRIMIVRGHFMFEDDISIFFFLADLMWQSVDLSIYSTLFS